MSEKIIEQIGLKLEALALKLGVAAGQLWEILITQSYVQGIKYLIWGLFFSVVTMLLVKHMNTLVFPPKPRLEDTPKSDYETQGYTYSRLLNRWEDDKKDYYGLRTLFWSLIFISSAIVLLFLSQSLTCLLNPRYYALQMILETLK